MLGVLGMVHKDCSLLDKDACIQLLKKVLKSSGIISVLKFLFLEPWASRKSLCSDSGITMKQLLPDHYEWADKDYIDHLLKCSLFVGMEDAIFVIRKYSEDGMDLFKHVVSHFAGTNLQSLCQEAWRVKKLDFMMYIIKNYQVMPTDYEIMLHFLLEKKRVSEVNYIIDRCFKKQHFENINFYKLLQKIPVCESDLVTKLIDGGVSLNEGMAALISSEDWKSSFKARQICLLINHGADCKLLSRPGPTVLHVATELSLIVGMLIAPSHQIYFCIFDCMYACNNNSSE